MISFRKSGSRHHSVVHTHDRRRFRSIFIHGEPVGHVDLNLFSKAPTSNILTSQGLRLGLSSHSSMNVLPHPIVNIIGRDQLAGERS